MDIQNYDLIFNFYLINNFLLVVVTLHYKE